MTTNPKFNIEFPRRFRPLLGLSILLMSCSTVFLAASGASPVPSKDTRTQPAASTVTNKTATQSPLRVIAYYFHATVRCQTCRAIEAYSREVIEQTFAEDLKKGTIEWRPINIQAPENRHFIQDFRLYTRSLILVKVRNGKHVEWKNLDKVWDLVRDKGEFLKYVQSNVSAFLRNS
jgi:hypothetical protein